MADSEIASGLLEEAGHALVDTVEDAEVLLITTCIVKKPTEQRMLKNLRRLKAFGIPLVVAGCMPKAERWLVEEAVPEASLMGPDDIPRVVEIVDSALKGRRLEALNGEFMDKTCFPRTRRNPVIHIAQRNTNLRGFSGFLNFSSRSSYMILFRCCRISSPFSSKCLISF